MDEQKTEDRTPRSLEPLQNIKTSADFAVGMSALMGDVIAGRVTPQIVNAVCNAGGKLLKVKEMELKFGNGAGGTGQREITFVGDRMALGK